MSLKGTITEEDLVRVIKEQVIQLAPAAPQAQELNPTAMKDITEALGEPKTIQAFQDLLDAGKLTLPKPQKKAQTQTAEQRQDDPETDPASMELNPVAGGIRSLDGIAGQGIPWGSALAGGGIGLAFSEVIDGFQSRKNPDGSINFLNVGLKGGAAWSTMQFLPQFTGKTAALFTSGFLLVSILQTVTPLDDWIRNLVDWVQSFGGGNRFAQPMALNPGFAQQPQQMGQFITGVGEAGSNRLDFVFSPD